MFVLVGATLHTGLESLIPLLAERQMSVLSLVGDLLIWFFFSFAYLHQQISCLLIFCYARFTLFVRLVLQVASYVEHFCSQFVNDNVVPVDLLFVSLSLTTLPLESLMNSSFFAPRSLRPAPALSRGEHLRMVPRFLFHLSALCFH